MLIGIVNIYNQGRGASLQKTYYASIFITNYLFYSAFFTPTELGARRSQHKHFTALNSRYYTYSSIQGSLRLH